jgi:hypothetical protein
MWFFPFAVEMDKVCDGSGRDHQMTKQKGGGGMFTIVFP